MNWVDRNAHWALLALVVVTTLAVPAVLGASALALLAGALGGASLGALLADAAATLAVTAALVAADLVLVLALVVVAVRRVTIPRNERLAALLTALERFVPPLRGLGLSERFAPTFADRKRALKRRYVDGELTEAAFEREMDALLAEAEPGAEAGPAVGVGRDAGDGSRAARAASSAPERERDAE